MKRCCAGAVALTLVGGAQAAVTSLDFEFDGSNVALPAGTFITNQFPGVTITTDNADATGPDNAILFDSANPTGEDSDLATASFGNILIIAEDIVDDLNNITGLPGADGLVDDPDDEDDGGTISFLLDAQFDGASFDLIDTEEVGSIDFLLGGSPVGSVSIPAIADGATQNVAFAGGLFDEARVNLAGSGAVGGVTFTPAPSTLALLGIGLMISGRRRG